jgi:hypothetical protein
LYCIYIKVTICLHVNYVKLTAPIKQSKFKAIAPVMYLWKKPFPDISSDNLCIIVSSSTYTK